ncbi:sodium bicarbonate transporter-like protein 11 isoform X2 [Octopus sinensis]|uniref:Sodium bicarbonate transporter-like protein 11 isoform X2 n=1 Tax=Octopus sinensis TaxID=2607531 RepID=A0A7E6F193_9MOLL|nr:sodium bicarbonate transporter-like protein 11 isoform X2 [Octopus sinensis]
MAARNSTYIEDEEEEDEPEEIPEIFERNISQARPVYGSIIRDNRKMPADAVYASTSREIYPKNRYYSTESSSYCGFPGSLTMTSVSEESVMDDEELLYRVYERLPLKDFSQEIRAHRDVDNYLCNTLLLLDIEESNMEDIVQLMIDKVLETQTKQNLNMADLMKTIFAMQRVDLLSRTIQGVKFSQLNTLQYDHTWLCMLCEWPTVIKRHTVIARLLHPVNMGCTSQEVVFVILVVASNKEKSTKSVVETARTFCTLFADMDCRCRLLEAKNDEDFRNILKEETRMLFSKFIRNSKITLKTCLTKTEPEEDEKKYAICQGIKEDLKRRLKHYMSDYKDGLNGKKALRKVVPASLFLYFACILPNVAYGMIISNDTHGAIDIQHVLLGQFLAGILFSLIGGQTMNILLTTAPLTLFTRVVANICDDFGIDFLGMFACVGIWSSIFLISYSIFGFCNLLKWSTRSTEDIFYTFVSLIFFTEAMREMYKSFQQHYFPCQADIHSASQWNTTLNSDTNGHPRFSAIPRNKQPHSSVMKVDQLCQQETSILFIFLMTATLWLATTLSNFTKTPYLSAQKRQLLADYAIPLTILIMTIVSTIFSSIYMEPLLLPSNVTLGPAPLYKLSAGAVVTSFFLGFSLSLLFFINHNISSAQINNATYKLKKGSAYHWDLLVIAIINIMLSIIGCPWMHVALPVSSQHVKSMAQMEERVEQGSIHQIIVQVRETRVTSLICYMMLGLSLLLLPHPLADIPRPVLCGYFLYMAIIFLSDRQLIDRFLLLITEQSSYPPSHYIRRVPQRDIHKYTFSQMAQLLFLCIFGLVPVPYIQMFFPMVMVSLVFIRHMLVPKVVEKKHLAVLD